jgi:hypothetical protein
MFHSPFGQAGWNASCAGLGAWNLGHQWGDLRDEAADSILRLAIESDIMGSTPPSPQAFPMTLINSKNCNKSGA